MRNECSPGRLHDRHCCSGHAEWSISALKKLTGPAILAPLVSKGKRYPPSWLGNNVAEKQQSCALVMRAAGSPS